MSVPVNNSQDEARARGIMVCKSNIMREHHVIFSNNKNYVSLAAYKDTCKHILSTKEYMLKLSTMLLRREGPCDDSKFENPPIASRSTRVTSTVKHKLELTAEETGSAPKRMIDEECSSSSITRSSVLLRTAKRRKV